MGSDDLAQSRSSHCPQTARRPREHEMQLMSGFLKEHEAGVAAGDLSRKQPVSTNGKRGSAGWRSRTPSG
jgi:hypothetical protein